jgi:sortase (surface protein transpeptidase)
MPQTNVPPGTVLGLAAATAGAAVMAATSIATAPAGALSVAAPTARVSSAVRLPEAITEPVKVPVDRPGAGSADPATVARRSAAARKETDPAFVRITSIGATSSLIELGLQDDGTLETPVDFSVAGWYSLGPRPGQIGAAVIAGHLDSYNGPAVFARLPEVQPGDQIEITRKDGVLVTFEVTRIDLYPKDRFPTMSVYGPTEQPELRLITCGGSFDKTKGSYRDNIVVYAKLIPNPSPTS